MFFVAIVGFVLGISLIYKNGTALNDLIYLKKHGKRTFAEVIENRKIFDNSHSEEFPEDPLKPKFIPIFKFKDELGREYILKDSKTKFAEKQKIGLKKEILYDPENPSFHLIDSNNKEILLVVGIALGIGLFLISSYFLLKVFKSYEY